MTLLIEPLKERLILHRKTLWGAFLESLVIAILAAMVLELVMGWLINQPDPTTGEYPFWDNSQLPGNVFGQAWLVNDFFIGLVAMIYVWVIFPLVCEGFSRLSPKAANVAFALIIVGFAGEVLGSNATRPPSRIPKRQFCAPALHRHAQADTIGRCN